VALCESSWVGRTKMNGGGGKVPEDMSFLGSRRSKTHNNRVEEREMGRFHFSDGRTQRQIGPSKVLGHSEKKITSHFHGGKENPIVDPKKAKRSSF